VQQSSQTKLEKELLTKDMKAVEDELKEKGADIAGQREQLENASKAMAALNAQLLQKETQLQTQMQAKESLSEELAPSSEEMLANANKKNRQAQVARRHKGLERGRTDRRKGPSASAASLGLKKSSKFGAKLTDNALD
jgi:hypothetical protein